MATGERGDPIHASKSLAISVFGLDRDSRGPHVRAIWLQKRMVVCTLREFLRTFRLALREVVPLLPQFKNDAPIRHAGISGTSYHDVTCRIALEQYRAMWPHVDMATYSRHPESRRGSAFEGLRGDELTVEAILEVWPAVAKTLSARFADVDPIDYAFLCAGIDTDRRTVP